MDQETSAKLNNHKEVHVEFLLEEPSMMYFLEVLLPIILPKGFELGINCHLRPHEGKSDLKKSIPKKIRTFSRYFMPAKIIIVHDQDSNDCKALKNDILELCKANGEIDVLIRIPCRELENWYLGDMNALEKIYPDFNAKKYKNRAKFRNPDNCFGSFEIERIIPDFQKKYAAKNIPKHFDISNNSSESFNQFISGLSKFLS